MLNKETHRQIMYNILVDIFSSDLSSALAFKGGTACYFFHSLDRFSTDLDFDILNEAEDIDEKIISILQKYGTIKKKGRNLTLSYGARETNIKIDLSRNIWKNNNYEIVNFFGTDIKVQDRATIFSNKLVALLERNTNRDIYDVHFFLQHVFERNEKLFLERLQKSEREIFKLIIQKLENLPKNHKMLDGLGEVLELTQKAFVKNKLLPEVIAKLQFKLQFD